MIVIVSRLVIVLRAKVGSAAASVVGIVTVSRSAALVIVTVSRLAIVLRAKVGSAAAWWWGS